MISTSQIRLPTLTLPTIGIDVMPTVPHQAFADEPFVVCYQIVNKSPTKIEEVQAIVDINDAFVFTGHKQVALRLMPLQSITIRQRCLSLQSGYLALPHCRVMVKRRESEWTTAPSTALPQSIFVMPQRKTVMNSII